MDLEPFLQQLRRDLAAAAQTGDEQVRTAAGHLIGALDPSARLVLLDLLVSVADELSAAGGPTVEVRLRGRGVDLVAQETPRHDTDPPAPEATAELDDATARVSLRLPETLKIKAEARAAVEALSLNTWLVRAVIAALDVDEHARRRDVAGKRGPGTRLTGWARS